MYYFYNLEKNINVRKKIRKLNTSFPFRKKRNQVILRPCK
jgi:hypothetical protein